MGAILRTNLLFAQLLLMLLASAAMSDDIRYDEPRQLSRLENRDVNESSGLAASCIYPDRFWTHNDSGDRPRLFCFDVKGNHVGSLELKKAKAVDWEDMCSYERDGKPRLLIGDIGDNGSRRKSCRLYLVDEPQEPNGFGQADPGDQIKVFLRPDGPRGVSGGFAQRKDSVGRKATMDHVSRLPSRSAQGG